MYQIITAENRDKFVATIDSMHRIRYDVCVTQWGWDIPGIQPGYDKDQFDTEHTVYITITDPDLGKVVASTRLNPTSKPHMMSELFAHYCNLQDYPVADNAVECSRYVIDRTLFNDPLKEFRIRTHLGLGIVNYCLANGIDRMSWLTHQRFYQLIQRVWKTEPLGLPVRETPDGWAWIPAVSQIDEALRQWQLDKLENAEVRVEELIRVGAIKSKSAA